MTDDSFALRAVPVLVPMPAARPYTYAAPAGMHVVPGSIVRVPLGPREVAGIVWDGDGETVDPKKLRPISQVFACPPIDHSMRRFVDWTRRQLDGLIAQAHELLEPYGDRAAMLKAAASFVAARRN